MTNHADDADSTGNSDDTNATSQARSITVRTPADVVVIVSHLLGFMPTDSLVVVALGGRIPVSRIDFPHTSADLLEAVESLGAAYARRPSPDARALLLAWTNDTHQVRQVLPVVAAMLEDVAPVVAALQVHDGEQPGEAWTDHTDTLGDHPDLIGPWPTGTVTTADRDRTAAELIGTPYATPAASREARASTFQADPEAAEATRYAMDNQADALAHTAQTIADLILITRPAEQPRRPLSAHAVARLAIAINDQAIREALVTTIRRSNAEAHRAIWTDVARRTPASHRAAPLVLCALTCWLTGDGTAAWIALDAAQALREPDEQPDLLSQVVTVALQRAEHPDAWERSLLGD